jgi:hypothetical protein
MNRIVPLVLLVLSSTFVATRHAAADTCVTARLGSGLGAARIDFTLAVDAQGPFTELLGEARFSQPIAPPGGLIIYAVTGVAIPNADGMWVSLTGTGYDLAKTLYRGTFAAQLSADPAKNTFSYTRQNLDGSGAVTSTSTLPIITCPQ